MISPETIAGSEGGVGASLSLTLSLSLTPSV
jgi:hypothetical protein